MAMPGKALGVIIAGGSSRRFNQNFDDNAGPRDKFLMPFGTTTLLGHIILRAKAQIPELVLNVNGDRARILPYGLDVIGDDLPDAGPLGGILAAMTAATKRGYHHIVTFSGDSPFFPADYVSRLAVARENDPAMIAIAGSGDKIHPVMGFFPVSLQADLRQYINHGDRRVMWWIRRHHHKIVVWDNKNPDPFFNINQPQDLERAARYLAQNEAN